MMNRSEMDTPYGIDGAIRIASILVLALGMSVVVLGVVGTIVAQKASGPVPAALVIALVAAATFALLGSLLFRRFSYHALRLRQVFDAAGEPGLASHMLKTTIVSTVLAEAVAIVGLIMGTLTGDTYYLYALCAIALLGVLSNFPRARRWRELSSEITATARAGTAPGGIRIGSAQ
jgi:hypothetical protein